MSWYPCCCADVRHTIYVPCCVFGVSVEVRARCPDGFPVCVNNIQLTHSGLQSVNHGNTLSFTTDWLTQQFGSYWYYFWDLPQFSPEDVFLPTPNNDNFTVDISFKNLYGLSSTGFEVESIALRFGFYVNDDFEILTTTYPNAVTGSGWSNLDNLLALVNVTADNGDPILDSDGLFLAIDDTSQKAEGHSSVSISGCSSRSLKAVFGKTELSRAITVIDDVYMPYRKFKFTNPYNTALSSHLCMKAIGRTTQELFNVDHQDPDYFRFLRDCGYESGSPLELTQLVDDGDDQIIGDGVDYIVLDSDTCFPQCSCNGARYSVVETQTCDNCRYISNTPIKLGGYGLAYPEPAYYEWEDFIYDAAKWTVYGFAKSLKNNSATPETLFWAGQECQLDQFPHPNTSISFTKNSPGAFGFWTLEVSDGHISSSSSFEYNNSVGEWFFWFIRKTTDGEYDAGIITVIPPIALMTTEPIAMGDLLHVLTTILGEAFTFDTAGIPRLQGNSFAGCLDGLAFVPDYLTNEQLTKLSENKGTVAPPPPPHS